jgi:hypothetical protein
VYTEAPAYVDRDLIQRLFLDEEGSDRLNACLLALRPSRSSGGASSRTFDVRCTHHQTCRGPRERVVRRCVRIVVSHTGRLRGLRLGIIRYEQVALLVTDGSLLLLV